MKTLRKTISLFLALVLVLGVTACGGAAPKTEPETSPVRTEADTKAPSTAPETTAAETTAAPTTEPPTTEEPTTEPPTTEEPTTEEPTTAAPALEAGWYKLYDWPSQGGTEAVEGFAASEIYYFLVIEEDGKGYFYMAGQENEISWDDKNITMDRYLYPYQVEDGVLTLQQNNQPYMIFRLSDEKAPERGETLKEVIGLYRTDEIILKDETLIDNDEYSVVANGITLPESQFEDYTINLTITNKTIDDSLGFGVGHVVVNGITVRLYNSDSGSVKQGETKEMKVNIDLDDLKETGVGDPTKIDLYLGVKPQYDPKYKFEDYLTIYPMGQDKAELHERKAGDKDQVIEDNEQVKLIYLEMKEQAQTGYAYFIFWLENKTEQVTRAQLFINALNGTDAQVFGSAITAPHSSGFLKGLAKLDELNGLNLDEITEIGFSFDLDTDSVNPKTITEGNYTIKP